MRAHQRVFVFSALILVLLGGGMGFYLTAVHVRVSRQEAQGVGAQWDGHKPVNTTIEVEHVTTTWVVFHGYLHRDWEVQRSACMPGPSRCQFFYTYTVFVNGQSGTIDDAMIGVTPGDWPLLLAHTGDSREAP